MPYRISQFSVACLLAVAALMSGCSSSPPQIYQQERFDAMSSPYARTFQAGSAATCEAARRALLSQGYIASQTGADAVDGSKNFQPNNDSHVVIEFHVVCADENTDGTASIAYVNAVQDRYTLKKTNTSASVGLSVLGSLSLPIGSSDDSMVKVASETIPAGVFYERYFDLVAHFLKIDPTHRDRATAAAAENEVVAPLPVPAPTRQGEPMKLETPRVAPSGETVASDAQVASPAVAASAPVGAVTPASAAAPAAASVAVSAPVVTPVAVSTPTVATVPVAASIPAVATAPVKASPPAAASAPVTASAPAVTSAPVTASIPAAASAPGP